ncbi:MAG: zinc dependent phospholipase C family protein [Chloroflexota bacterium]|nr:zinc dependent phospholipase C family protein [Chloroflexota bacterium]
MAPLITHLVIGERVFAQLSQFDVTDYDSFLLGCLLADVNNFASIDRRRTHFAGKLDEDGVAAFTTMCTGFLRRRDDLLPRPWSELDGTGQAFVSGYLCHLAADEEWKRLSWNLLLTLGIESVADLPVPGGVVMTAFSVLSSEMFVNFPAIVMALNEVSVPNVLMHVQHGAFQAMWDIVKDYVMNNPTPESFLELLRRQGKSSADLQVTRARHETYWDEAITLIRSMGGVEPLIQAAVEHSLEVMPLLGTDHSPHPEYR